jgi:hypothetical protein
VHQCHVLRRLTPTVLNQFTLQRGVPVAVDTALGRGRERHVGVPGRLRAGDDSLWPGRGLVGPAEDGRIQFDRERFRDRVAQRAEQVEARVIDQSFRRRPVSPFTQ